MAHLVWTVTGDTIPLDPVHEVYDYFVEQLNVGNLNRYLMPDLGVATLGDELQTKVTAVRNFLQTKLRSSAFDFELDPTNQVHLNALHRQWVKVHQQYPQIGQLFDTQIPGALDRINKVIHAIEDSTAFCKLLGPNASTRFTNPFGASALKYGTYNLTVSFDNLGRTSWQKWLNNDTEFDSDTNNFDELYTTLIVRIVPPATQTAPLEYQQWCNHYNIPCTGNQLVLANFDNVVENLLKYKQVFYQNSLIENNFIILE
jgi:hypothetical protein